MGVGRSPLGDEVILEGFGMLRSARGGLLVGMVLFCVTTTGCGGRDEGKGGIAPNGKAEKVLIRIRGSDTLVNLVQRLTEEFMKERSDIWVAVTGGGSGTGIAALINKEVDIADASRAMKSKEIELAKERGVEPVGVVIALDGLAIVVNESLPVDSLTLEQLGRIYRGEIKRWSEVGGPDMEMSLYGRTSASGTFVYFRDKVVKGDYSPKMKGMIGNSHIVEAVKKDKAGIGYVGIGYAVDEKGRVEAGLKVLRVAKDARSPAVTPLKVENVKEGLYPLARPLYQFTNGKPKGAILEFIRFELSKEGQKIVEKEGFYPITPDHMKANKEVLGLSE